ncbi:MAG: hypothetical protein IJD65_04055 [Mailhella sp.]|nr:hypothetical protein [Mailhella sp.]
MKKILLFLIPVLLSGCLSNGFSKFYHGKTLEETQACTWLEPIQIPEVRHMPNLPLDDILNQMYTEGFAITGYAAWEGPNDEGDQEALEQAAKVGAALVLWRADYTHTKHGSTTHTTYHPGKTIYTGSSFVHIAGTTSTHTTPYSVDRYSYDAIFFGKLTNTPDYFRARIVEPPISFFRAMDKRIGGLVTAVMKDSIVYQANIFPGDIILKINDTTFTHEIPAISLMHAGENTLTIWRDGKEIIKTIFLP